MTKTPEAPPRVLGVQVSKRHSFSKPPADVIRLVENLGVEGDAHAGATDQHLFHVRRFGQQPNLRQVHLIQAELFDELSAKGHKVRQGDLGENISTLDAPLLTLPTGTRLRIGDAVIELTGLRNPCRQIEAFQPGLLQHVTDQSPTGDLIRKAGVMGIVLKGGEVRPGDAIKIELPPEPHQPLIYRIPGKDANASQK